MPLTADQATSLLTKAKQQKPDLSPIEAKAILAEGNKRIDMSQPAQSEKKFAGWIPEAAQTIGNVVAAPFGKPTRVAVGSGTRAVGEMVRQAVDPKTSAIAPAYELVKGLLSGKNINEQILSPEMQAQANRALTSGQEQAQGVIKEAAIGAGTTAAGEYIIAPAIDKVSKTLGKFTAFAKDKITGIPKAISKQAEDDIVNTLAPSKIIRKEAGDRGINIANEHMTGGYTANPMENVDIARRKVQEANTLFNQTIKNKGTIDFEKTVNDVLAEKLKTTRLPAEKEQLKSWAIEVVNGAKDKYGSTLINPGAAAAEKSLAGASGYKSKGLSVVETKIGEADAALNRSLKQKILGLLTGGERIKADQLLREQEKALMMGNIYEDSIFAKLPRSTAQKIGRLFNLQSLGQEVVGNVGQKGVSLVPQATTQAPSALSGLPTPPLIPQQSGALQSFMGNTGKVISSAIKTPAVYMNPAISALQRAIDNESKSKQTAKKLP